MAGKEPGLESAVYRSVMAVQVRSLNKSERDELMGLLTARVGDVFDEGEEPFFWSTRASNDRIDAYFTHMLPTSLENYARDADEGVQFQVSHNGMGGLFGGSGDVGFGRSLRGKFSGKRSADPQVLIDFYTVPGLVCGNMTSDQFIKGARTGIYSDVSIGFMPGEFICDICGNDMLKRWTLDWDDPNRCDHYLGMWYEVEGDKKGRKVQCTAGVSNAHLNEVSVVFDGATPGAGILAVDIARMAALNGELNARDIEMLEQVYRTNIPRPAMLFAGGTEGDMARSRGLATNDGGTDETTTTTDPEKGGEQPTKRGAADTGTTQNPSATRQQEQQKDEEIILSDDDDDEEGGEATRSGDEPMERLRAKYEGTIIRLGNSDPHTYIEALADEVIKLRKSIKVLEREAKDGRDFREAILKDLDASVVRAYGSEGSEERMARQRRMVAGEDIQGIRAVIADLEDMAKARIGEGGRTTKEVDEGDVPERRHRAGKPHLVA